MLIARREARKFACEALRIRPVRSRDDQRREPPERRISGALTRLDLAVVERLAVGRDQRLHHRMFGLMRLQIADTAPLLPPGTPDHLIEELERALGRARVAVAAPEIGIARAATNAARKDMSLRP